MSDNVALVVGARGVIGGNLVRHLQDLDGRQVIASRAAAANQQERSVTCPSSCLTPPTPGGRWPASRT